MLILKRIMCIQKQFALANSVTNVKYPRYSSKMCLVFKVIYCANVGMKANTLMHAHALKTMHTFLYRHIQIYMMNSLLIQY